MCDTLYYNESKPQSNETIELESIQKFVSGDFMAYREGSDEEVYISDLNMNTGEWDSYSVGEIIDLDNDGEGEQIINGPYGGMYIDETSSDGKVIVFAEGEGAASQLSYVYYDENSDFTYRGEKITMEQYEQIYNKIM